ncbi:MAG: hypothetical protein KAU46_08045 [Candidatus Aminicenantes bacterium]|nr:hypothetical protein [Candidatus Aminicenantes bacterium]
MARVYRPRHPERTVLYRVLFHHFERFLAEYEMHFEREYRFLRPIIKEVVGKANLKRRWKGFFPNTDYEAFSRRVRINVFIDYLFFLLKRKLGL